MMEIVLAVLAVLFIRHMEIIMKKSEVLSVLSISEKVLSSMLSSCFYYINSQLSVLTVLLRGTHGKQQ